ncbi:DUF4244 domain-containing protein [Crossiella sp. CA-258035]|uniref:DUF4244 domain-containing protein n=1 Tax=Crossiella sp. CA-258035 TaxID=2981138 RepID=UPI0024BCDA06|nr:DUF4244 domain-containing protein [Crossiella sp. CA-258035]WHT19788.1 DUF4244 domain-containing protein [Crossiella sp. CA-258035]
MLPETFLLPKPFPRFCQADDGTVSVEYALSMTVAAVLAGGLLFVCKQDWVVDLITDLVRGSLTVDK